MKKGLSLMEMLITLAVVAMIIVTLFQCLSQYTPL